MKRIQYKELLNWKKDTRRKPLIVQGARQVGKTWLIKEFGKNEYKSTVYLNFEQDPELKSIFESTLQPDTLIEHIELFTGEKIIPHKSLLIFDEIQALPKALTSLKYFYEQKPEIHIIAAGSLLGVSVGKTSSFPVGKVNFMHLYPMRFDEYLLAAGEELLHDNLQNKFEKLPEIIHEKLLSHLKRYLFLGGMPEVLQVYFDERDYDKARKIQKNILIAYQNDFSKYSDKSQAIKNAEFWQSVPYQLAKENKKFKYSDVRKRSRASHYQQTMEWLRNAGLIHPAYLIKVPKLPLSGYIDFTKFKIYLLDTGLLGAMLNLLPKIIIEPNRLFVEYNGAFIENYVATQLITNNQNLQYWRSRSDAEVDFILQIDDHIIPLEVKSGISGKNKSLRSYAEKYKPDCIIRTSPQNIHIDKNFLNIPLYRVFNITQIIENKCYLKPNR